MGERSCKKLNYFLAKEIIVSSNYDLDLEKFSSADLKIFLKVLLDENKVLVNNNNKLNFNKKKATRYIETHSVKDKDEIITGLTAVELNNLYNLVKE